MRISDWSSDVCSSDLVSEEQTEAAVRAVIHQLRMTTERELPSRRVGEFVMAELRKLDHVAYVRFASVYRSFEDVADFREELDRLERDLPGEGQLPLLGAAVVPFDKNAGKGKKKGYETLFPHGSRQPRGKKEK